MFNIQMNKCKCGWICTLFFVPSFSVDNFKQKRIKAPEEQNLKVKDIHKKDRLEKTIATRSGRLEYSLFSVFVFM